MKTTLSALSTYLVLWIVTATTAAVAQNIDYASQIKPIFNKYCTECHGEEDEQEFRIDVDEEMILYVNAGHPETSDLYVYMTLHEDDDDLMPPVDHEPRPELAEIQLVSDWITQGAKLSGAEAAAASGDEETDEVEPVSPERQRIYNALGSLHTAAVHLPIGLLLAAGLFGMLSLGGSFVMSDCAYYCLWLGTLGAIFATASGWFYSPMEHRGTVNGIADFLDQTQPVYWHRLGAIISTVVALLLCLFAKGARGRNPDDGMMWKLGAILLAGGIGWVGHTGGELTYGKDHYKDLNELVDSITTPAQQADMPKADMNEADVNEGEINKEGQTGAGSDRSDSQAGGTEETTDI